MDSLRTHRSGTTLPHLADVERLSPDVIRILGDNPSKVRNNCLLTAMLCIEFCWIAD